MAKQKGTAGMFVRMTRLLLASASLVICSAVFALAAAPGCRNGQLCRLAGGYFPPASRTMPLYEGVIPNSIEGTGSGEIDGELRLQVDRKSVSPHSDRAGTPRP